MLAERSRIPVSLAVIGVERSADLPKPLSIAKFCPMRKHPPIVRRHPSRRLVRYETDQVRMSVRRKAQPSIEIPHTLAEAVRSGSAVAVLGAGASKECRGQGGRRAPDATQLRDHLAKRFLGTAKKERDLATVAEMAIAAGSGLPLVFDEVSRQFQNIQTSAAHAGLAGFRWRGLATTNYDLFIEEGYRANAAAPQTCVPFVKNTEPFDDRLRAETHPVALLKLHGCLDHRLDPDVPLLLSHEHYDGHDRNREHLFERLKHWAQSSVLVFIGYRLADPHIRQLIYRISPSQRPQWYLVSPGGDDDDRRFWSSKNVELLPTTFGEFVEALDQEVSSLFRALPLPRDAASRPYRRHFRTDQDPSERLVRSLDTDFAYVHGSLAFENVSAEKFYAGYDTDWCGIVRNYDFARKVGEDMLYAALDETAGDLPLRFELLLGQAGAGKTIALRRAAFDAATALDQLVLWLTEDGEPRADVLEELYSLTGLRVLLFVDHVSLHAEALERMLYTLRARNVPITVIASEREAEWGTYCRGLNEAFTPTTHTLRLLSAREAEALVDLLERHQCLGHLAEKPRTERIASFLDKAQANRQLLVALHELTQGRPFEDIILDEYERINPEVARSLYLDIATMHQFGVMARAGAISRISSIRFLDFKEEFLAPLQDIVRTTHDRYTGDDGYETRHAHVARLVFRVACEGDEERATQLARIITGLDTGYSSDRRILSGICRGREIAQAFVGIESAREIFDTAMAAMPSAAFLFQQAAILEMQHDSGSLDRAEELALEARELDSTNHIYLHTLAEVARRKARAARSPVQVSQLRAQSRSYLNSIHRSDPRRSLSYCNLLIDEVQTMLHVLPDDPKEYQVVEFDEKVGETVKRLHRAQRDHPGEAEFPAAEGRLYQLLGEEDRAERVLKIATGLRANTAGVFFRLAQILYRRADLDAAIQTLQDGLERFQSDKELHLQMALRLIEKHQSPDTVIDGHFRASYGTGDHAYDARFYHAAYLFWAGKIEESRALFNFVDEKANSDYRTGSVPAEDVITARIEEKKGTIEGIKDRYFFVRFGGWPKALFAHVSSLIDDQVEDLTQGAAVRFHIRFNRKGPMAVSVKL